MRGEFGAGGHERLRENFLHSTTQIANWKDTFDIFVSKEHNFAWIVHQPLTDVTHTLFDWITIRCHCCAKCTTLMAIYQAYISYTGWNGTPRPAGIHAK
jgi:hypothetical protein